MAIDYVVLGSGQQGTFAAYDLAQFGEAGRIVLADSDLARAQASADRVNGLLGRTAVEAAQVDAGDEAALTAFLVPFTVALCCLPYFLQPIAAAAAVRSGTHICDLDGDEETPEARKALDPEAKANGVACVADTGLAPGLVNSLGLFLMGQLDETESVRLYCGVLPQNPKPPLNYKITFSVEGLVAEYDDPATVLRGGEIQVLPPLTEVEEFEFPGVGLVEAFTTGGGVSTAPFTLKGKVPSYEYKTIRFPGHSAQMRLFRDLGFWETEGIPVAGQTVVPRQAFAAVLTRALVDQDYDQCLLRAEADGVREGEKVSLRIDLLDRQDPETGFTSMQRLTGACIAIHAIALGQGRLAPGAYLYEEALDPEYVLAEFRRRGHHLDVKTI